MRDEPMAETNETGVLGSVSRLENYLKFDSPGALTASTTTFLLMLDIREEGGFGSKEMREMARRVPKAPLFLPNDRY